MRALECEATIGALEVSIASRAPSSLVGDVDDDAETIQLGDGGAPERGEASAGADGDAVAEEIATVPGEADRSDAEPVEHAEEAEVVVDRHRPLERKDDGYFTCLRRPAEVARVLHEAPAGRLRKLRVPVVEGLERELRGLERPDVAEGERREVRRVACDMLADRLHATRSEQWKVQSPRHAGLAAAASFAYPCDEIGMRREHERLRVETSRPFFLSR